MFTDKISTLKALKINKYTTQESGNTNLISRIKLLQMKEAYEFAMTEQKYLISETCPDHFVQFVRITKRHIRQWRHH